jgi:flagellar hook-basal body complex protein FliE
MSDIQFQIEPMIAPLQAEAPVRPTSGAPTSGGSFASALGRAVEAVDKLQLDADQQADAVAHGAGNLHEVAISLDKADVAIRLASKVRNKVVDAYNDVMKMSV